MANDAPALPVGKTTSRWYGEGYRAAMRDILAKLDEEGMDAAIEWANNNA